jgi:hypothetical protein
MRRRLALSDTIKAQLREMAQLSVLSNRINEIQEKNLKMYPFVFFNDVKSVKIEFDLSKVDDNGLMNHGDHHVTYFLDVLEESNNQLDRRMAAIEASTRSLFWNDLKVRVVMNGKLAYESKNVREPTSNKT